MPIGDTILLQKKYTQIYYIWVWNDYFFSCTLTLNVLPMYCLVKTLLSVILMFKTGFAFAGVRTSGLSHFAIGQSFSIFACTTDKAIWSKKESCKQQKIDLVVPESPWGCWTATTVHTWRPHSRAPIVKWRTSGLWNSLVVFGALSGDLYMT